MHKVGEDAKEEDAKNERAFKSGPRPGQVTKPPVLDSRVLFRHCKERVIEHGGQYYYLRLTRQNKLILTK